MDELEGLNVCAWAGGEGGSIYTFNDKDLIENF